MNNNVSVMITGPGISVEESVDVNDATALDALRKLLNNNLKHLAAKAKRTNDTTTDKTEG